MNTILPWHEPLWQQLLRVRQQDRLPHALLLCGAQGMGKSQFAQRLAEFLLCEQPHSAGQLCQQCKACYLLKASSHPDLLVVQPVEVGKQIVVDQIRELIQFCALTSTYGRYQVIIIQPAEAMNHNAANSLLKLLEEPPQKTILMLVSHQPMALSATIRSRCQRLDFSHADKQVMQKWLKDQVSADIDMQLLLNLSNHAPLAALALVETGSMAKRIELFDSLAQLPTGKEDPVRIAELWNKLEATQVLTWMLSWTMDLIRYTLSGQVNSIVNRDRQTILQHLAGQLDVRGLFNLLDLQRDTQRLLMSATNVKAQGLLETIAIAWVELGTEKRRT